MPSLPRPAGPVPIARAGRVHSEPPDRNRRYIQDLAIWRRDPRLAHAGGMRVLNGRTKDTLSLPSLPLLADGRSGGGGAGGPWVREVLPHGPGTRETAEPAANKPNRESQ